MVMAVARMMVVAGLAALMAGACGDDASDDGSGDGINVQRGDGPPGTATDGGADGDGDGERLAVDGVDPDGTAGDAGTTLPATLPFVPANLPAAALVAGAPGDLVVTGASCGGGTTAKIDTDGGSIGQCPLLQAGIHYRFARVAQSDGSLVALFATRLFRLDAGITLTVTGALPLVIVAFDRVEILGKLEAGARDVAGVAGGFAGRDIVKDRGNGPGAGQASLVGGGGGGSYCGRGGKGGSGNAGGAQYGSPEVSPLVGGSSGASGGVWGSGAGGGAVQLVAGIGITITGTASINVGGAGGMQSGGGGGSGGALLLEAPAILVAGVLAANGGGGGSGEGQSDGQGQGQVQGEDGQAGETRPRGGDAPGKVAPGGPGTGGAAIDGGDGQLNSQFPDGSFSGGGGGGAGFIRINTGGGAANVTGILSPAAGTPCASQGLLRQAP
jgi:hypothetical protein